MSIVAHSHPFVVGVDTHARNHVYAIITAATGVLEDTQEFPTTTAGITRAMAWVARRTGADLATLWVIEGAASYGAILAGTLAGAGYAVAEAARMDARAHHGVGKTDALDAQRIARAVLALDCAQLRRPRLNDGVRAALRVLVTAREAMTTERTRYINALTALVRVNSLGLDARKALTRTQITEVSHWRSRQEEFALSTARAEAIRLAKRILDLDTDVAKNHEQLTELVAISEAAPLLDIKGFGPVSAAACLISWSHKGRVNSEAGFASLAGVNPIPASSGNTIRHRLNRGGDRALNKALHTVAKTRMIHDEATREYVEKRTAEGRTYREIRRILKRYLARSIYKILNAATEPQNTAPNTA